MTRASFRTDLRDSLVEMGCEAWGTALARYWTSTLRFQRASQIGEHHTARIGQMIEALPDPARDHALAILAKRLPAWARSLRALYAS